jgi:hypothetical protein
MERCPHCRAPLSPPKTCPGCGEIFYRGQGGRTDAACCSERCAARIRKRRQRKRTGRDDNLVVTAHRMEQYEKTVTAWRKIGTADEIAPEAVTPVGRCWNCSAGFIIGKGYGDYFCSEPCGSQFTSELGA